MYKASKGETLTKLEIAKRELSQGILLFFEDRDPITYYMLAHTSHEIIRNIANAKGIKSIIKDDFADMVNEDGLDKVLTERYGKKYKSTRKQSIKKKVSFFVNYDYNNVKHGGSNADEEVTIHWEVAQIVMFDSIDMLKGLEERLSAEHIALMLWIKKTAPEIYNGTRMIEALEHFERSIGKVNKSKLLDFIVDLKASGLEDLLKSSL